ncbi:hypothetical protein BGZ74_011094 [Mortierella antarctica]|nr:hypothetical protein BGZ74_011094 [Mortierella antarctica]
MDIQDINTNFFRSPTECEPVSDTLSYGVELAFGGKVYQLFASDDGSSASSDYDLLRGQRHLCHEPLSVFFQEFRKYVLGPRFGLAADKHQMILGLEGLDDPLVSEIEAENDDCTLWEFWEQAAQPTLRFEMHIQVIPIDDVRQPLSGAVKGGATEQTLEAGKESSIFDLVDVDEDALSDDDIQRFLSELKRRESDAQMAKINPEEACINSPMSSPPSSPQESTSNEDKGYLSVESWIYNVSSNHYDDVIDSREWSYEDEDSEDSKALISSSKRKLNDGYDGDLSDSDSDDSDSLCESSKKVRVEY